MSNIGEGAVQNALRAIIQAVEILDANDSATKTLTAASGEAEKLLAQLTTPPDE